MKKTIIKYTVASLIAVAMAFGVMFLKDLFHLTDLLSIYMALCDAFTVPGLLYLLFGLLLMVARGGSFDGLAFAVRNIFVRFKSNADFKNRETYYDYKERKRKARKEASNILFIFVIGAVFSVVAVVFLILYLNV